MSICFLACAEEARLPVVRHNSVTGLIIGSVSAVVCFKQFMIISGWVQSCFSAGSFRGHIGVFSSSSFRVLVHVSTTGDQTGQGHFMSLFSYSAPSFALDLVIRTQR
jgi:hypothetical protein